MILFYSDVCRHSRMLIETIKRYDPDAKLIKFVSVDTMRAAGKRLPPQILEVPSLVTLPDRKVLCGKHVFDYLLLPGSGKLLRPESIAADEGAQASQVAGPEPSAFTIGQGFSDNYAHFDSASERGFEDRTYTWTSLEDDPMVNGTAIGLTGNTTADANELPFTQEETRRSKNLLDMDTYRQQRDMELTKNDLNNNTLPQAVSSR